MGHVEIEVRAKTVELAVEAAMVELGVEDRDDVSVKVLSEPVKGFLGIGGEDAVVLVSKMERRGRRGSGRRRNQKGQKTNMAEAKTANDKRARSAPSRNRTARGSRGSQRQSKDKPQGNQRNKRKEKKVSDDRPQLSAEEQAKIAHEFLEGLVDAYGLEGIVQTSVDDDVIIADVEGEQTEALVGIRGSVRSAIHELTRTVIQRYTQDANRLRLDIAGYAERRRQALAIYAEQLIEQLRSEGGEIMLEPMSPADRKVIHDVAAQNDGIGSYSEGEAPRRYVVLTLEADEEE